MHSNLTPETHTLAGCSPCVADWRHHCWRAPQVVFLEGNGSAAELVLSLALGITLVYLPLSLASLGRRLWVKYRFTNKRLVVITDSPALKREVAVAYTKIKEIRSVPRAFGLWGDCVFFLKDGSRLELLGVDNLPEIRNYVEQFITDDAY